MSIQSQIDRINGAKDSLKSAISSKGVSVPTGATIEDLPALVRSISQEGGSGSGIIDVTQLPTDGIDEGAVYRLTESYKSSNGDVMVLFPDEETGELVSFPLAYMLGAECECYLIDSLEEAVALDITVEPLVFAVNILRTDGIAYIFSPEMIGETPLPIGLGLFQIEGFDKGYTDNIYLETEMGVYTTREQYDTFQRWFIRENGEWKEISAHINLLLTNGTEKNETLLGVYDGADVTIASGGVFDLTSLIRNEKKIPFKINVDTPCIGDILNNDLPEHIPIEWFKKKDGTYVYYLDNKMFCGTSIISIDMPDGIEHIGNEVFCQCSNLTLNKLPENVMRLGQRAFSGCHNITITDIPSDVYLIEDHAFEYCGSLTTITFHSVPNMYSDIFKDCPNLTTINVPWGELDQTGAPWGATNATINYNYTEG